MTTLELSGEAGAGSWPSGDLLPRDLGEERGNGTEECTCLLLANPAPWWEGVDQQTGAQGAEQHFATIHSSLGALNGAQPVDTEFMQVRHGMPKGGHEYGA